MRSLTHEPMLALEGQPDAKGADLAAALREVRTQFEGLATRNMQEAEEWYKMKVTLFRVRSLPLNRSIYKLS